ASGREVYVVRFYADCVYKDILEGTREEISEFVLRQTREGASRILPPGKPMVVVTPKVMPLPRYRLVAELESSQVVRTSAPDFSSRLFVCWFADSLDPGLGALLRAVLESVDWDANAEEFDIMDF